MKKKFLTVLVLVLALSTFLAACGSSDKTPEQGTQGGQTTEPAGEPKVGGTITYGFTQPFKGLLEPALYQGEDDSLILNFMTEGLFMTGDDLKTYPNIASWTESEDHKTFTFTFKQGVKWHNGEELTVEDWKYALEVIANKEYTGKRYSNVEMIEGADEYHAGTADHISGITVIDPYTIEIKVKEAQVNTLDNLWSYPMPRKHYEGIAIKDLDSSPQVRQNPVGLGPFKVKKVNPGESVELVRYDEYWQGKPLLDGVTYKVIDGSLASGLLKNGEIDIMKIPNSQVTEIEKLNNVNLKEADALSYSYIGFDFGHWDAAQEKIVMDNPKFQNKQLRQAMAYAIDRQGLLDAFSNGKGTVIDVPMPTVSWAMVPEDQITHYSYDPDKAMQLLDEAGYKDVDGDGFREDPQGNKFTVNFDAMSGSDISEPRAQAILQNWKDVGIDARLNGGALKEFNLFYDTIENDDPSVETFMGAWGLSSDPDPSGLWRSNDEWNFPRWYTEESDRLIAEGIGEKAFDFDTRKQIYFDWQKIVNDELPMIFLYAPKDITAVNNRLQGVEVNAFTNQKDVHKWWVTDTK